MGSKKQAPNEIAQAQRDGRIDGLHVGREYTDMLFNAGRLSGPFALVELDGDESGYVLRASLHRALEGRRPRDARMFAIAYAATFCAYFDLAVIQLTIPDDAGYANHWYTPARVRELLNVPYRTSDELARDWRAYQEGRFRAGYAIQRATHPDWRLPLDEDGETSAPGGAQ